MRDLLPQAFVARPVGPLEHATRALLRLVRSDGWSVEPAALALSAEVHDDALVLRLLQARVARAMLERPTRTDQRARATIEQALTGLGPVRTLGGAA
jgi:hypothetical protein